MALSYKIIQNAISQVSQVSLSSAFSSITVASGSTWSSTPNLMSISSLFYTVPSGRIAKVYVNNFSLSNVQYVSEFFGVNNNSSGQLQVSTIMNFSLFSFIIGNSNLYSVLGGSVPGSFNVPSLNLNGFYTQAIGNFGAGPSYKSAGNWNVVSTLYSFNAGQASTISSSATGINISFPISYNINSFSFLISNSVSSGSNITSNNYNARIPNYFLLSSGQSIALQLSVNPIFSFQESSTSFGTSTSVLQYASYVFNQTYSFYVLEEASS